jgi:hypothetical protein
MRRRRRSVEALVLLTLVVPAWLAFLATPQDVLARPRPPDPGFYGWEGPRGDPLGDGADPDALGNEAPALPPVGPGTIGPLGQEVAAPAAGGMGRMLQALVLELRATGVLRLLMRM